MIIKLFERRKDGRGLFVTKCKKCCYFKPNSDDNGGYCKKACKPLYWMPIPEPPKEEEYGN